MIDFDNCGSFGYVCPSNYTSCSAGVCSKAPGVQLKDGVTVFNVTSGIDDRMLTVQLPLSLTMYNYSSSNITFTTNGVSFRISIFFKIRLEDFLGCMSWNLCYGVFEWSSSK